MLLRLTAFSMMLVLFCGCRQPPLTEISQEIEAGISTNRIRHHLSVLTQVPHRAGTPENQHVAAYIAKVMSSYGFRVTVEESETLLHQPLESSLQLISPVSKTFNLREKVYTQDPYSAVASSELPFLAYSPDASITAELVYANYGDRADYELLKQNGISLAGKIALVRAQGVCRSMKSVIAEEEGLAALLLYPEPRDMGFVKPPFPEGPHINPWAVQRGTLLQTFRRPGDPTKNANETLSTLPRVAALPVSGFVATELLNNIKGIEPPAQWKGWLKSDYRLGTGPAIVQFRFRGKLASQKIRNVIARLSASKSNTAAVIAGAHYDAWVYGASDPSSGVAVLMETAHVISQLSKRGWKPQRQILFAFWDAEEYGMHGSTNWVKQNSSQLPVAIYWNMDTAVRGKEFAAHLAPGLRRPLRNVLQYVDDPGSQRLLSDLYSVFDLPGFTADTAPFTGLAGVPTAEVSFGHSYPLYHTLYDDFFWFEHFADPDFQYSAALSKLLALSLYFWATERILPYQFSEIGTFGQHHLAAIKHSSPELAQGDQMQRLDRQMVEYQRVARKFESARTAYQRQIDLSINVLLLKAVGSFFSGDAEDFATANALFGPDHMTGCNGEALPALQRALHSKKSVKEELERLQTAYARATALLQQATEMLNR